MSGEVVDLEVKELVVAVAIEFVGRSVRIKDGLAVHVDDQDGVGFPLEKPAVARLGIAQGELCLLAFGDIHHCRADRGDLAIAVAAKHILDECRNRRAVFLAVAPLEIFSERHGAGELV